MRLPPTLRFALRFVPLVGPVVGFAESPKAAFGGLVVKTGGAAMVPVAGIAAATDVLERAGERAPGMVSEVARKTVSDAAAAAKPNVPALLQGPVDNIAGRVQELVPAAPVPQSSLFWDVVSHYPAAVVDAPTWAQATAVAGAGLVYVGGKLRRSGMREPRETNASPLSMAGGVSTKIGAVLAAPAAGVVGAKTGAVATGHIVRDAAVFEGYKAINEATDSVTRHLPDMVAGKVDELGNELINQLPPGGQPLPSDAWDWMTRLAAEVPQAFDPSYFTALPPWMQATASAGTVFVAGGVALKASPLVSKLRGRLGRSSKGVSSAE